MRNVLISGCIAFGAIAAATPVWAECDEIRPTIPTSRYVISGDEVHDTQSDLTWQRCSAGQSWTDGEGCVGEIQKLSWDQAKELAKDGWRLPTKDELITLISKACTPSVNPDAFPNMDKTKLWYWSSDEMEPDLAGLVYFDGGATFNGYRTSANAVRLVRSGE